MKVKQLRQAIKDDLGIKDKVSIKLYLQGGAPPQIKEEKKTSDLEEIKEGDQPDTPAQLEYLLEEGTGDLIITDDKMTLKEAGIIDRRDKLEVEIVIKVAIDVQGKGKDYSATIEVSPDAPMLITLQSKLSFFKTFY